MNNQLEMLREYAKNMKRKHSKYVRKFQQLLDKKANKFLLYRAFSTLRTQVHINACIRAQDIDQETSNRKERLWQLRTNTLGVMTVSILQMICNIYDISLHNIENKITN